MSRTDKTAPYRVKQAEHPDEWWRPEFRCTCPLCKEPRRESSRRRRRDEDRVLRAWRDEYESPTDAGGRGLGGTANATAAPAARTL